MEISIKGKVTEINKGDKVVFSTLNGKVEGKVIELFENEFLKVRYGGLMLKTKLVSSVILHDVKRVTRK